MKQYIDNDDTELTTQLPRSEDDQASFTVGDSHPATQLPASDDTHAWTQTGEADLTTLLQSSGSDHDFRRSHADRVARPKTLGDRVASGEIVTQAAQESPLSEDPETALATRIHDVREQLESVLSENQIQIVVDSLVSVAAFTAEATYVLPSAPSAAPKAAPSPSHDVPFFEKCIFKKECLKTPPPKPTTTPRAPRQRPTPGPNETSTAITPKVKKRVVFKPGPKLTPFREAQLRRGSGQSFSDTTNSSSWKMQQSSRMPTITNDNSRLLSLPGELRNRIYRMALLDLNTIDIDRITWTDHQPALVRTCKQIRGEALPLFYRENKIAANIHDWDPTLKERLNQLVLSHCGRNIKYNLPRHHFSGGPHWANLIKWLKGTFEGNTVALSCVANKQRAMDRKIIGTMFKIVGKAAEGSTWAGLLDILQAHRHLLAMTDEKWLVDAAQVNGGKAI